jgi:hypothetical protein
MDEAIRLTKQTIEARSARFRNLVVGVVVLSMSSLVCALAFLSWKPVLGTLLLLPFVSTFLWRDAALVHNWRRGITDFWVSDDLNLDVFSRAIRGMPIFPPATLDGMLAELPTSEHGIMPAALSPRLREALAATLDAVGRLQRDRMALSALAYTIGLSGLVAATLRLSWEPLAGLLLILPTHVVGRGIAVGRFRRRWQFSRGLLQGEDERRALAENASRFDWEPIPAAMKQSLLGSMGFGEPVEKSG